MDDRLEWRVHLARRRPRQAAGAGLVIAAASLAAGFGFQSPFLGMLAAILLTASVADYLLPLRYTLGAEGIEVRGLWHRRRMEWPQVRRVTRDDLGVKLSPLARPSRLEAYRGIYVWFADNEAEVMSLISHHTATEAGRAVDLPPS